MQEVYCIPIDLCPDLKGFDSKVRAGLSGKKYSTDIGLNTVGVKDNIESAFVDALKRVKGKGIFSSIGGLITAPFKASVGAISPIFFGLGTSIGLPLGSQIGTGLAKGLQTKFGNVIGSFELIGNTAGALIGGGVNSGFTQALASAKANSEQIVKVLEQTLGKERLTKLFGVGYASTLTKAIQDLAPATAITQALGETDVLIESRALSSALHSTRLTRKQAAVSQLQIEKKAAVATREELKKSAENLDAYSASFAAEYRAAEPTLTREQQLKFQAQASFIAERKAALSKQAGEIQKKLDIASTGLANIAPPPKKEQQTSDRSNLPSVYTDIAQQVAALSGIGNIPTSRIPQLKISELIPNGSGSYDHKTNQLNLPLETFKSVISGKVTPEIVEVLVHELRHAVQTGFGGFDVVAQNKAAVNLLTPDPNEIKRFGSRVENSVEYQHPQRQELSRSLEADAYTFADRNAPAIADNIKKAQSIKGFEQALGLGGGKADLQLKRSLIEQFNKIHSINSVAAEYGINLQIEVENSLQKINAAELRLEPLLEKARSLEVLPAEEITALQKEISLELQGVLTEVASQSDLIKKSLIQKKIAISSNASGHPRDSKNRDLEFQDLSYFTSPNELETRVNQLTKPQLNKVAKKLGIKYSGKKADILRSEILNTPVDKLESALPAVIAEISSDVKQQADTISKLSLDAVKARASNINTIIQQASNSANASSVPDKATALKELLDTIERERQLIKETLTRDIDKNVKDFLKSQLAVLGLPRRRATVEYSRTIGNSNSNTVSRQRQPPSVEQLARSGGNSLEALPSFEDVSKSLESARRELRSSPYAQVATLAATQKRLFETLSSSLEFTSNSLLKFDITPTVNIADISKKVGEFEASTKSLSELASSESSLLHLPT